MAEDFRSRLRRLRREEGPPASGEPAAEGVAPAPEPAAASGGAPAEPLAPPAGLSSELDDGPVVARPAGGAYERLKRRDAPRTAAPGLPSSGSDMPPLLPRPAPLRGETPAVAAEREAEAAVPPVHVAPRPRGELSFEPPARIAASGATKARTTWLPLDHAHGDTRLGEWSSATAAHLAGLARDERIAACDLSRALFLDTETSGLSGGAGTYVWLVGLGRFVDAAEGREAGFEVWQGFLDHPSREAALLAETAARIAAASMVVTFFGKSFDRHRLEDKMRLHGVEPPFARTPHLDLYWPLRRAHRGKWSDCRLKTLEHHLCGVRRHDDLPGSFAPAAWFDFLAGRPHRLEGVFRHNHDDILSLVSLAVRT